MTIAEYIANRTEDMELVTPERILAPEIGSTSYPAYMRALNANDAKVTMNFPQAIATHPAGAYQLFRIGDAVASRKIHAAILDAYRLMIAL